MSCGDKASRRSTRIAHDRRSAGFTLLETLVAFAIAATAVLALAEAIAAASRSVEQRDQQRIALLAAQSTLARIGRDLPMESGRIEMRLGDADVIVSISPFSESDAWNASERIGAQRLARVVVEARASRGGPKVALETLRWTARDRSP